MKMAASNVFSSIEQTLEFLQESSGQNDKVKELLHLYEKAKASYGTTVGNRKHIFIVLEGLDGSGKSTMTKMASKELKASLLITPPNSIQHLRSYFDESEPKLRRAYYSLGNYLAAMEGEKILTTQHVVMDRFWHSTAAYALAESHEEIPPKGDTVFKWPKDLLKPDIIIFLNVDEEQRRIRTRRRQETTEESKLRENNEFRSRLYEAYGCMEDLTHINSNATPKQVFRIIMENAVKPLLENICMGI